MTDRPFVPRELAAPTAIITVLSGVAALGFRGIFPDWSFASAAAIGAVGASAVMLLGRWARLAAPETMIVSLVAFILLGAVAAEGLPTPGAFAAFFDGLVNGWAQVLSSSPPADLTAEFRVLPYAVSWFGAMLGGEILRSGRTPGLAVFGPVSALGLSLLITLENRSVALVQGLVIVAGALMLGYIQQRRKTRSSELFENFTINNPKPTAGLAAALGVTALISVAAPFLGPQLPFAEANERFDLREFQTPPFDPLEEPSPLVQLKAVFQTVNSDEVVFRVTTTERIDRIQLAVLDDYDGEVWAVADEAGDAPGEFRPVDSVFPPPGDADLSGRSRVTATVEIDQLSQLSGGDFDPAWLPTLGWPISIVAEEPLDIRFNRDTGTVALAPDGPEPALVYTIVSFVPPDIGQLSLGGATVTKRDPYDLAIAQLRDFASDVLEGADVGWEQVEAIRSRLADGGFYDNRAGFATARPGHSLARLTEFVSTDGPPAGFEEQYAAVAALIARSEGLPTRVVVGYLITEENEEDRWDGDTLSVHADDMSAWIEVRFDEVGWVPFDVTPPRDREPEETSTGRSEKEVARPNPPPDPPPIVEPPRLDREEDFEEDDEDDGDEDVLGAGFPARAIAIGVAVSSPAWLAIVGGLGVVVLKRKRSMRRRNSRDSSRRIAGAWHEVVDRYQELGAAPRRTATPAEYARGVAAASLVGAADGRFLLELANDVDVAAFHPTRPSTERADGAWGKSDAILAGISKDQSGWRRLRHQIDPRPLFQKDPLTLTEDGDD